MNRFDFVKVLIFSLALAVLIYPNFQKLYLYRETIKFEDFVMAPLGFLAEDQVILSDSDRFSRYNTNYKSLELLRGNNLLIGIKNEFLFHEKWVNISAERERVYDERLQAINESYKKLLNGTYSLIVVGPAVSSGDLKYLTERAHLNNTSSAKEHGYCTLIWFTAEQKCNSCQFLLGILMNNETCNQFIRKDTFTPYVMEKFGEFCKLDKILIENYYHILSDVHGIASVKCEEGNTLLLDNYVKKTFQFTDFLRIIYLAGLISILFFRQKLL